MLEQLAQARRLNRREKRSMSELVREALRRYQQEGFWERIAANRARAESMGLRQQAVIPIIKA